MSFYEVPSPILNSPYQEPKQYWKISRNAPAEQIAGRRPAGYFYKGDDNDVTEEEHSAEGSFVELELVNRIRKELKRWRDEALKGGGGVTATTCELLNYWRREGRKHRFFFAQLEAAETVIFLNEARSDFLQGINIPLDEPGDEKKRQGFNAFKRYATKMATGSGKTTVMGLLAAWSILNKVHDRSNSKYSDAVLVVCPNVTIRNRLAELNPSNGEASIYRKFDIVPPSYMPDLNKGKIIITNWHNFEPKTEQAGGVSAKVLKTGIRTTVTEKIKIGQKTTVARGRRYLTLDEFERQIDLRQITVEKEKRDKEGNLIEVEIKSDKYIESDTALINRILGREIGGKQNILVFNDEAHHAYRIKQEGPDDENLFEEPEDEGIGDFFKEATVWVDGLDKIHKQRGINFCIDLSATPYYLGRVGQDTNKTFPWIVSDFGLTDAIESGLVKVPQMVARDSTGSEIPGYFNVWHHVLKQMTTSERGGKRIPPKPEAVLKYSNHPIAMLATKWLEEKKKWAEDKEDSRLPIFIIVCKNTKIAKLMYEWIAEDKPPHGIPNFQIEELKNKNGFINTIRVDSKVVQETDSDETKNDESRWMRFTLDTVGLQQWPLDTQNRPLYPEGFQELAEKLKRPLHPPGKDVRCIVSVGMLTEGWDCKTVTHIIGLRPFMSQLLCEQVVGRGLRRKSYDIGEDEKLTEEVAQIFGVPFEIIPFKISGAPVPKQKRSHIFAVPNRSGLEIKFPRVVGYHQKIKNKVTLDWISEPIFKLDPTNIPDEVQLKATLTFKNGHPSLLGPGRLDTLNMNPFRQGRRFQQLVFDISSDITRSYCSGQNESIPAQVLFPQLLKIVDRYLKEKVKAIQPCDVIDIFLSPFYGYIVERISSSLRPDTLLGEEAEVPVYESNRTQGSTLDVDYWTSKDVFETVNSHVNAVVADTKKLEQSTAYIIDNHPSVDSFVKNAGLGFAIPYFHKSQTHDYIPDFIIRLKSEQDEYLILETKGYDELAEIKQAAAFRWCNAINQDDLFGSWSYKLVHTQLEARNYLDQFVSNKKNFQ